MSDAHESETYRTEHEDLELMGVEGNHALFARHFEDSADPYTFSLKGDEIGWAADELGNLSRGESQRSESPRPASVYVVVTRHDGDPHPALRGRLHRRGGRRTWTARGTERPRSGRCRGLRDGGAAMRPKKRLSLAFVRLLLWLGLLGDKRGGRDE